MHHSHDSDHWAQVQEFQLGQKLRALYLDASSPSFIPGVNSSIVNINQIKGAPFPSKYFVDHSHT
jgi:hypothetical protein